MQEPPKPGTRVGHRVVHDVATGSSGQIVLWHATGATKLHTVSLRDWFVWEAAWATRATTPPIGSTWVPAEGCRAATRKVESIRHGDVVFRVIQGDTISHTYQIALSSWNRWVARTGATEVYES